MKGLFKLLKMQIKWDVHMLVETINNNGEIRPNYSYIL